MKLMLLAVLAILTRQAAQAQTITTVAGNGTLGYSGDGGPAIAAAIDAVASAAVDGEGNLYMAEPVNRRVRKISPDGKITTAAGNGELGVPPAYVNTEGKPATSVALGPLRSVAVDSRGNLYIADQYSIRKVDAQGVMTTLVGLGTSHADGIAAAKTAVSGSFGVAAGPDNSVYYSESVNVVRRVDANGLVTTVAGMFPGTPGAGGDGGPATKASLYTPEALAVDRQGNLYISDSFNHRIRRVSADGIITTVMGGNPPGYSGDGGTAAQAAFRQSAGLACDAAGNLYFSDTDNARVRRIGTNGIVTTIAGSGISGFAGDGGAATAAKLYQPRGLAMDSAGSLWVGDASNYRVRRIGAAPAGETPRISAGGVVNAASFAKEASPGSLISIFGTGLAGGTASAASLPLPLSMLGTAVSIGGVTAPLIYVSPGQLNLQLPFEAESGTKLPVVVTSNGVSSAAVEVVVTPEAPGILMYEVNRAVAQNPDGSLNSPGHPAKSGDVLTVYLTGAGRVTNRPASGAASPSDPLSQVTLAALATVGGRGADVLFAGLAPGFVGLMQVNLRIPAMAAGDYPLVITQGAASSNPALIRVQ